MNAYPLLMAGLSLLAVGCTPAPTMGTLEIVSLTASQPELTEGQSVTLTAIVNHTGGLQNVTASRLLSPDGQRYGAFAAGQPGVYSLTVDWQLLDQILPIAFATEEQRTFTAEFSDNQGHTEKRNLTLRLHCGGRQACQGVCSDPGAACSAGACILGVCQANCPDGQGGAVGPGGAKPDDGCRLCTIRSPGWEWTSAPAGTSCGIQRQCIDGLNGTLCSGFVPLRGLAYQVNNPDLVSLNAIAAFSANDLVTVSSRGGTSPGSISRSRDGGKTWTTATPAGTSNFFSVWGSSLNDMYVVGSRGNLTNGPILHSTDGGASWTAQSSGIPYDLAAVWGSGPNDVYVVGDGGSVLHSVDQGATWTQRRAGAIPLLAIWGSGPSDIYAVGSQGLIIHSVDSGKTWTTQTSRTTQTLNAVWGTGSGDVYIVGNQGLILMSIDGGTNWNNQTSGLTSNLNAVWGSGTNDVYVAASAGQILRTANRGTNWVPLVSGTVKQLLGLGGSGAGNVFVVGTQNLVMRRL